MMYMSLQDMVCFNQLFYFYMQLIQCHDWCSRSLAVTLTPAHSMCHHAPQVSHATQSIVDDSSDSPHLGHKICCTFSLMLSFIFLASLSILFLSLFSFLSFSFSFRTLSRSCLACSRSTLFLLASSSLFCLFFAANSFSLLSLSLSALLTLPSPFSSLLYLFSSPPSFSLLSPSASFSPPSSVQIHHQSGVWE